MAASHFPNGEVDVSATGAIGGDGSVANPLEALVDGVTMTIVNNRLVAPSGGGGTIGGNLGGTDNVVPRSNGTGGATLQASTLVISDAGAMSGAITLALVPTGSLTGLTVTNPDETGFGLSLRNATFGATDVLRMRALDAGGAYINAPSSLYLDAGASGTSYLYMDNTGLFEVNNLLVDGTVRASSTAAIGSYPPGSAPFAGESFLVGYNIASRVGVFAPTSAFYSRYTATDGAATNNGAIGLYSKFDYGYGGVAAKGGAHTISADMDVTGSGSNSNQVALINGLLNVKIGTGFTQTSGPAVWAWMDDRGVAGPIAVQPDGLNGYVIAFNNYYNGSPSLFPSVGLSLVTKKDAGPGLDAIHQAANSYPNDVGIAITGVSDVSGTPGIGWTTAIQLGGAASPWGESASKIGTGLKVRDYATAGINISNASATTAPSIIFDTFLQTSEMASAPSAPAANGVRIYAVDNGGGKTQLMALFSSGSAQQIAIQP